MDDYHPQTRGLAFGNPLDGMASDLSGVPDRQSPSERADALGFEGLTDAELNSEICQLAMTEDWASYSGEQPGDESLQARLRSFMFGDESLRAELVRLSQIREKLEAHVPEPSTLERVFAKSGVTLPAESLRQFFHHLQLMFPEVELDDACGFEEIEARILARIDRQKLDSAIATPSAKDKAESRSSGQNEGVRIAPPEKDFKAIAKREKSGPKWMKDTVRSALQKMKKSHPKHFDRLTLPELAQIAGGSPNTWGKYGGTLLPAAVREEQKRRGKRSKPANSPLKKQDFGVLWSKWGNESRDVSARFTVGV